MIAKPSGSDCNLNCDYCFYLEKQSLYREKPVTHMDDDTLEAYIRHYIAASELQNEVAFTWQGGEPTLLGLEFYRRAVALQAKYGAGRKIVTVSRLTACCSMTNGVHFWQKIIFLLGYRWMVRLRSTINIA